MTDDSVARQNQLKALYWVTELIDSSKTNEATTRLDGKTVLAILKVSIQVKIADLEAFDEPDGTRKPIGLD